MKTSLSLCMILLIGTLGLSVYLACLVNWLDEYQSGYYQTHRGEAWLKSGFLTVYTYLGVRFGLRHVNMRL